MNERQEFPIDIKWKGIDEIKVSVRRRGKSAFFSVIGRQFGYGALTVLAFVFSRMDSQIHLLSGLLHSFTNQKKIPR